MPFLRAARPPGGRMTSGRDGFSACANLEKPTARKAAPHLRALRLPILTHPPRARTRTARRLPLTGSELVPPTCDTRSYETNLVTEPLTSSIAEHRREQTSPSEQYSYPTK